MSKNLVNKVSGKSDKNTVYSIEKEFSVGNIEQIKQELDEIIGKNESFTLELKNLDSFDLSAIQLVKALKDKLKDKLIISLDVKDDIRTIIQHSGFEQIFIK